MVNEGNDNLNAGNLTAYCLKLDVEDPNNCVETHNALSEVNSDLRQAEIERAKQENIDAQKKMEEAEKLAKTMKMFSIIMTLVSIALLICTLGAATPAVAAGAAAAGGVAASGTSAAATATGAAADTPHFSSNNLLNSAASFTDRDDKSSTILFKSAINISPL